MTGAGENGAAMTGGDWRIGDWRIGDWRIGDWRIGDWSSARMLAPVGMGAWNWLSGDRGAVEAAVVAAGETGVGEPCVGEARTARVGKTEAAEVEDFACAVGARVGTLGNEYAASEAA